VQQPPQKQQTVQTTLPPNTYGGTVTDTTATRIPADTLDPKFQEYARPDRIVSTQWVADNLDTPGLVIVESDEDVRLYESGHIPGAVKIDWHTELNDPVTRDYVDGKGFAKLMSAKGISREDTLVVYGDKSNWWAAYAMWVFSLFGHEDVRLMEDRKSVVEGKRVDVRGRRVR